MNDRRSNNKRGPNNSGNSGNRRGPQQNRNNRRRGPHSNKPQHNRGNRRSHHHKQKYLDPTTALLRKHDHLEKAHMDARKKYFELFHRVDDYKRNKLERTFFNAVDELRKFEESLKDWQVEIIQKKKQLDYKLDQVYSQNHNAGPETIPDGPYEDPMVLESQTQRESYNDDTEESMGSLEDYKAYKGL